MDIEKMADQVWGGTTDEVARWSRDLYHEDIAKFAALVVEECAKVCDKIGDNPSVAIDPGERSGAWDCAEAIRSLIKPSSPEAQSPDERPL